jgi:hypothetical protein
MRLSTSRAFAYSLSLPPKCLMLSFSLTTFSFSCRVRSAVDDLGTDGLQMTRLKASPKYTENHLVLTQARVEASLEVMMQVVPDCWHTHKHYHSKHLTVSRAMPPRITP